MNWKNILLGILGFIVLVACNQVKNGNKSSSVKYEDFKEVKELKAEHVNVDSLLLRPIQIQAHDSVLMLMNSRAEKMVHLLNLKTGQIMAEHVSVGQGPDEMLIPRFVETDGNSVMFSDLMSSVVQKYDMEDFLKPEKPTVTQRIKLSQRAFGEARLLQNGFVAPARNAAFLMYKFDSNGSVVDSLGSYPVVDWNPTDMEKIDMFAFSMSTNLKDRIAVFYNWADIIDFYNQEGTLIKRVYGPGQFVSKYKEVRNGEVTSSMGVKGETRDAYFAPQQVQNEVWVLFSGKASDEENYSILANTIYVYDWDGNPQRVLKLDQGIFAFAVDQKSHKIYGISDSPEFHILSFSY